MAIEPVALLMLPFGNLFKCCVCVTGIWKSAMELLAEYVEKYGHVHVMLGPIFDNNSDGHYDSISDITRLVVARAGKSTKYMYLSKSTSNSEKKLLK